MTDACLPHLCLLHRLLELNIFSCGLTGEGQARLLQALPGITRLARHVEEDDGEDFDLTREVEPDDGAKVGHITYFCSVLQCSLFLQCSLILQ